MLDSPRRVGVVATRQKVAHFNPSLDTWQLTDRMALLGRGRNLYLNPGEANITACSGVTILAGRLVTLRKKT